MRKVFVWFFILPVVLFSQKTVKALFIGNSYTYVNNLPQLIANIAHSKGDSLVFDSNTPGGYTLQMHCSDANTLAKIALGSWDYVIVQCQSQEPSFDPTQVATDVLPYAHKLDSLIHAADTCVETVFYMTWGRKNGDASNCGVYPPVCTFAGMQGRLRESYLLMGQQNNATVCPVGCIWREVRGQNPLFDLYQADESHPSIWGSYIAACSFYQTLFQKQVLGASFISTLSSADASMIQQTTNAFFQDSLNVFASNGNIPFPSFSFSESSGNVQFNNTSVNGSSYFWDFGDGTNSVQQNPNHIYSSTGNYTVTLTLNDGCMSNLYIDTLSITSVGMKESDFKKEFKIFSDGRTIYIGNSSSGKKHSVNVYSAEGKLLYSEDFTGQTVVRERFSFGLYIVKIFNVTESAEFKVLITED